MPRAGETKWVSVTYTKKQLEDIIGSFDSTPTENLVNGLAGLAVSLASGSVGTVFALLGMSQAAYARKEKKKFEAMLEKAKNSSSITIEVEYKYIFRDKNKQGWIPTGNYRY